MDKYPGPKNTPSVWVPDFHLEFLFNLAYGIWYCNWALKNVCLFVFLLRSFEISQKRLKLWYIDKKKFTAFWSLYGIVNIEKFIF